MPAKMAEVITPDTQAPMAQGRIMTNLLALWASFCATFAVVGTCQRVDKEHQLDGTPDGFHVGYSMMIKT